MIVRFGSVGGADRGSLRRVLVVDDAPDIRLLVRLALDSSDGYSVVAEAATGVEAIELAARHQPDVVLLDVSLPGMDGLQALPRSCGSRPGRRVVMFSAFETRALADTALRLGAVGYITKDIVLSNLAEHLTGLLDTVEADRPERATVSSAANVLAGGVERFHVTFEQSTIGAAALTLSGGLLRANAALCALVGREEDELTGTPFVAITHGDDVAAVEQWLGRLAVAKNIKDRVECRLVRPDGEPVWVLMSASAITNDSGASFYLLVQLVDTTERKLMEEALVHQAFHDGLTQLPNRALFEDRLGQALARDKQASHSTAVLLVDIDRFKRINDRLGHAAGDQLLVAAGRRLAAAVPPGDTVARLGGDEFAVLSEWVGGERDAVALAEHIAAALAVPFDLDDRSLAITVSVGVAVFPPGGTATPQTALYDADAAMYRAKDRGRRRIELADEDLRAKAAARLEEERALRRAINDGELRVYFQPVVELATGRILGTEALVRWQHPQRGLVAPSEFIGLAEDSGLIVDLGALVMAEACRQTSEWNLARAGQSPLFVAVNLSARQLESPGLHDFVEVTLTNSPGLDPGLLHLEITESVLMDDVEASRASLQALKALGITLVIDDFGTGYSSLLYLRRFPVDALKVDCSFVAGLGRNADDSTIVAAVVGLARALGLATVAEGVETADQAARLLELGCDQAQGYLWSPAVPADELADLLDRSPISLSPAGARVLIVDDDPVVRDLLRLALELEGRLHRGRRSQRRPPRDRTGPRAPTRPRAARPAHAGHGRARSRRPHGPRRAQRQSRRAHRHRSQQRRPRHHRQRRRLLRQDLRPQRRHPRTRDPRRAQPRNSARRVRVAQQLAPFVVVQWMAQAAVLAAEHREPR